MKNYFGVLLIIVLSLSACGGDQGDVRFVVRGDAFFDIAADKGTIETHFFTIRNQPTFITTLLEQNSLNIEDVSKILPAVATLKSRNSGVNLDFINEISVRAVSRTDPSNNREMFYLPFVEFDEDSEIRLLPSIANMKSIMQDEKFDLEVRLTHRRFPPTSFICDITFELDAFTD